MKTSPKATRIEFIGAVVPVNRDGYEYAAPHLSKTAGVAGHGGLMACNRREQEQISA